MQINATNLLCLMMHSISHRKLMEKKPTTTISEKLYFLTFSKLLSVTSYISSALGSMPNEGFPDSPKPYLK